MEAKKQQSTLNLCATDEASHAKPYLSRLKDLLENHKGQVYEIGVTGPYSAGKTSILKTFQRNETSYKYTTIALGSYELCEKEPESVALEKIEKSIVKQLIYRENSKKYSSSRFRRIMLNPKYSLKPFLNVCGLIVLILGSYIIFNTYGEMLKDLGSNSFLRNLMSINTWIISVTTSLLILFSRDTLQALKQHQITRLNFLKGEITFEKESKDSAFNVYLEEIIFYFQISGSDVVIFEDLDRLNKPRIFEKLKELNKIINDSKDVPQEVRFIYSIKDDIFKKSDRTKFFDALVPIVPIVNAGNAYPLIQKIIDDNNVKDIDKRLLRDIAIFTNDMRLIKNITSEYILYKEVLGNNPGIIPTKLFAFVVYKNCLSDDFAKLQNGNGYFVQAFKNIKSKKNILKNELRKKISELTKRRSEIDKEKLESLEELYQLALFKITKKQNTDLYGVLKINQQDLTHWSNPERFNQIIHQDNVVCSRQSGGFHYSNICSQIKQHFPEFEYREDRLKDMAEDAIYDLSEKEYEMKYEISKLDGEPPMNIARQMTPEELFESENSSDSNSDTSDLGLLFTLISEGYIDNDHHHYLSHFLEGNLTFNEMLFLENLKTKRNNDPSQELHNIKELIQSITNNDCKSPSSINFYLLSYLLSINDTYRFNEILNTLLSQEDYPFLLLKSLDHITDIDGWIANVLKSKRFKFSDVIDSDLTSDEKLLLIAQILKSLESTKLLESIKNPQAKALASFISHHIKIIYIFKDYQEFSNCTNLLTIKFTNLKDIIGDKDALENIKRDIAYQINIDNLNSLLSSNNNDTDNKIDFDNLLDNEILENYQQEHFSILLQMIISGDVKISKQEEIIFILEHSNITDEDKQEFITNVSFSVDELTSINDSNIRSSLLEHLRIQPNWENINTLYNDDEIDNTLVNQSFITEFSKVIKDHDISPLETDNYYSLLDFLIDDSSSQCFKDLAKLFKDDLNACDLSRLDSDKAVYLIESDMLEINEPNFNTLDINNNPASKLLLNKLISLGPKHYSKELLLNNFHKITNTKLEVLIDNFHRLERDEIVICLDVIGKPYDDILSTPSFVMLEDTPLNNELAKKLKNRGLISRIIHKQNKLKLTAKRSQSL